MIGMMMSATIDVTIAPNAAPMIDADGEVDDVAAQRERLELLRASLPLLSHSVAI